MMTQYHPLLSQYLPQHRIAHSLRVAQTTVDLGTQHNLSKADCYMAGALHDIAKYLSPSKAVALGLPISDETNACWFDFPLVWHQFAGAELIHHLLGNTPPDVLNAIRWHTTGTSAMPLLTQLVFIADYIEPGRSFSNRAQIEALAYKNLDLATYAIALGSIYDLAPRHVPIHPKTIECHNFYLSKISPDDAKLVPCTFQT